MTTKLEFNPLDNADWECYSGCEGDAQIAHTKAFGDHLEWNVDIVVDDNGISVVGYHEPDSVISYSFETPQGHVIVEWFDWERLLEDLLLLGMVGFHKDRV